MFMATQMYVGPGGAMVLHTYSKWMSKQIKLAFQQ